MNEDLDELAMALYLGEASFLIGSGFSMYLTENSDGSSAPNYKELLNEFANKIKEDSLYSDNLDKVLEDKNLSLQVVSGVLGVIYGKNIFNKYIAYIIQNKTSINNINQKNSDLLKNFFETYIKNNIHVFTTNYDKLIETILSRNFNLNIYNHGSGNKVVETNISQKDNVNIYHMHGNQDDPDNLVVSLEDYYEFEYNAHLDYIQQKFRTILHEQTVVILGYSLGDFNINCSYVNKWHIFF